MIQPLEQTMIQQCTDILHQHIGNIEHRSIPKLATYIILGYGQATLEETLEELVQQDIPLHSLLQALMESQVYVLDACLKIESDHATIPDIQALKPYVEHIHYISTALFFIDEKIKRDILKNKTKPYSPNMELFKISITSWKAQEKIKCINYYKGLPVQCIASLDGITTESDNSYLISLNLNRELLRVLSMSNETSVLLPSISGHMMFQLNVHTLGDRIVTLSSKAMMIFQQRKQLRLQPLRPIEIMILRHKKVIGSANLLDFSLTHFNVEMASQTCQSLHTDELIDIHITLQGEIIHATAWIRSIRQGQSHHILCLELLPNHQIQRCLQKEISMSQRKIIQEIKNKCALI